MVDPTIHGLAIWMLIAMGISLVFMIIIPILPGQFLIWLEALIFGILGGWEVMGGGTFAILTVLMILAAIIDGVAGWWGARRGGASWQAIVAGLIVGFIGLIFFNAIGAILGVLLGIGGYEYWQHKDGSQAWKAAVGYLTGLLVSLVVRVGAAILMIFVFAQKVL
jgi:uncharacterized protein YqgC (DUF456 family)